MYRFAAGCAPGEGLKEERAFCQQTVAHDGHFFRGFGVGMVEPGLYDPDTAGYDKGLYISVVVVCLI